MRHALVLAVAILAVSLAGCGDDAGGGANGVVGTYSLDLDTFVLKAEEAAMAQFAPMLAQMPPEAVAKMKEEMLAGMKAAKFDVELKADGTFEVTQTMQGDTDRITGTWTQAENVLTFVEVEMNGEPKADALTIKATLEDGNILYKPEPDMPFDLVLIKK